MPIKFTTMCYEAYKRSMVATTSEAADGRSIDTTTSDPADRHRLRVGTQFKHISCLQVHSPWCTHIHIPLQHSTLNPNQANLLTNIKQTCFWQAAIKKTFWYSVNSELDRPLLSDTFINMIWDDLFVFLCCHSIAIIQIYFYIVYEMIWNYFK